MVVTEKCPAYSAFFGAMGATAAVVFSGKLKKTSFFLSSLNSSIDFVKQWVPLMAQRNQVVVSLPWQS